MSKRLGTAQIQSYRHKIEIERSYQTSQQGYCNKYVFLCSLKHTSAKTILATTHFASKFFLCLHRNFNFKLQKFETTIPYPHQF